MLEGDPLHRAVGEPAMVVLAHAAAGRAGRAATSVNDKVSLISYLRVRADIIIIGHARIHM